MLTAGDVARFILTLSDPEEGDTISNLKLQKLVYYCQGFNLAMHDKPLFSEPIVAWTHGPVIESLYHEYKYCGVGAIPMPQDMDFNIYSDEEKGLMKDVYLVYGQFSAWKLRNMTHEEPTWRNTERNHIITHDSMKNYFKTQIED